MPSLEFDIIIGMDFPLIYRASIDYFKRQVVLFTPEGSCLQFKGDQLESLPPSLALISGKDYFYSMLSTLSVVDSVAPIVDLPLVVHEFLDVFLEYLSGLPLTRAVEFFVALVPGTSRILISPYRMALARSIELKTQLKELVYKDFIRPIALPWGAPVIFVKMKDG